VIPALALLERLARLAAAPEAGAAALAMRLGLPRDASAEELVWEGPPAIAGADRVRVRATSDGAVDYVALVLDQRTAPTRADLEAALGRAVEQPSAAGSHERVLAFPRERVTLLAYVDDATARASRLVARRD
jgi:hypothetical protein